ncbi:hypothetical protein [Agrococcus sp. HG114]|uniref:hypothetical protein n=1 Tax=Agrococcus sp. HG114 TaxID=2969757 RepID=UPI00215AFCC2|nr:hypothetical protein [Agrococcus sp. HG114]MCR8670925.1 hypothetical protein [Agrococcus sp. HG114]
MSGVDPEHRDGAERRQDPDDWDDEELEPQREWTPADRWRLAAWVLVFANVLGVLLLAPVGDGALVQAAESSGADAGGPRLIFWVTLLTSTLVGNGIGAAGAATKQRWAVAGPIAAAAGCWIGFLVASAQL